MIENKMASYFVCEIENFERWLSLRGKAGEETESMLMMACTYDNVFGIYEISDDVKKMDFPYILLSEKDKLFMRNLINSDPVVLGLSRDEVLNEKYVDMSSFVESYREALEYFKNNKNSCFLAKSKVNHGELEKGEEYWIYFDEDDKKKVFWLADGYFLYQASKYYFKINA